MRNFSLGCRPELFKEETQKSSYDKPFRAIIPARPDHYLCNLDTAIADYHVKRIIVGLRESDRSQNLNFIGQKLAVHRRLSKYPVEIIKTLSFINSGRVYDPDGKETYRPDLEELTDIAIKNDAAIFMEDLSRYVRPSQYTKFKQWIMVSEKELIRLKEITRGVLLICGTDPLMPPKDVRRQQTLRGRVIVKGKKRGKYSKARKTRLMKTIINMELDGYTLESIYESTKVPISTISRWLSEWVDSMTVNRKK